jgi:cAMP phosphodiesterase
MDIRILGCYSGEYAGLHTSGFLIDRTLLLEAGSVTSTLSLQEQLEISHILISHAHLDHIKELIFLVDTLNMYHPRQVTLLSIPEVVARLREHLFNDQLWPDFTRIPLNEPILALGEMKEESENRVAGYSVLPVRVDHAVPTAGFIISGNGSSVLYTADTGPTEELWRVARGFADLRAVFAECSFPTSKRELALESGHLTPELLLGELRKLDRPDVPVYITHIKPAFAALIKEELTALGNHQIRFLEQGATYSF